MVDGLRPLLARFPESYWSECDREHKFPWEFVNAFSEAGWMGAGYPEEYGGSGLGIRACAMILREVAASGGGLSACSAVHIGMFGLQPIIHYGSEDQRQRYVAPAATGELRISFGVTEPDAGTDTGAIKTTAKKVDGGWIVNGHKVWNSGALEATRVMILARTTPRSSVDRRTDGMSLLVGDLTAEQVEIRPIPKMGRHAVDSNELFMDDLFVPDEDLVGDEGQGFRQLLSGLNPERILLGAEAIGTGEAAMKRGVQYAKDRVVFGNPIGKNQGIQFPLAIARARLDAAWIMIQKAAWLFDQGLKCGRETNEAKWLAAEAGFLAADHAVQIHGGMGYAVEYQVERYFREARLARIGPVSQEMALNYVGEHVLGLPKSY